MNNKRSFTIEFNGEHFARLVSRTPKGAAQKAVSRLARKYDEDGKLDGYTVNDWNQFKLVETTRGSKKKTFEYRGMRKTLDVPIETHIAGKTIICKYDSEVHRIKKEDLKKQAQSSNNDSTNTATTNVAISATTNVVKAKGGSKKNSKKTTVKKPSKSTKKSTKKSVKKSTKKPTKKTVPTSDAKVISTAPKRAKRTTTQKKSVKSASKSN